MAFSTSYSDSAPSADVKRDANPGADSLKYRPLLLEIGRELGENDMEKLKYLCQDLGVAPYKFENMTQGIDLFPELEKLALISADDVSLLVALMQVIGRNDLVKKLQSWNSKEGNWAHKFSAYRILMLRISDSLSQDERKAVTFCLSGSDSPLPVAAIKKCKWLLQLFVLMEKSRLIGPGDLAYLTKIMQSIDNIAIVKEIEDYLAIERSSIHNIPVQPSSSPKFQPHQGGRVAYNTGNQSNMRSNSAPTFEGYTQKQSWGGQGYQGKPPSQQQQSYYNYPPQQYHHPQQRATPSTPYSQQNPQQWQQGQQPAIKKEPENRTSSATFGLTAGHQMPKWYYEAVQKKGAAYADQLWEKLMQNREDEVRKKMQEMKIAERRRVAESTPSVKTEPGDDKREATGSSDAGHIPDLQKYKMNRLPRGMCIIFNVENFATNSNLQKRNGTQKDCEALLNTFQNNLKFKTQVKQDPTKKEYVKCLQEIANMDHSEFDCFVCVILSHGSKGHVCDTDGVKVAIDALTGLFRGDYVPSLVNKPKLFFIQACQGAYPQEAVDIQQDNATSLPFKSDTLISLSTVPGYSSFRNVNKGSLFISSLCKIINSYYKEKVDLLSMLTMVNELMSRKAIEGKWMEIGKQIGNPSHTLRKQIFFNEGLDE